MKTIYFLLVALAIIASATSQSTDYLLQNIKSVVAVGNLTQQEVSAEQFKQQPGLRVYVAEDSPIYGSTIVGFIYMRANPKSKPKEFTVKGADFSIEALKDIATAKAGDMVYIDDIRVLFPDGNIRMRPNIIYKLI